MLLVRGKGGKERMVPLSPPAREAARAWLAHRDRAEDLARPSGHPPSPHLFPSRGQGGAPDAACGSTR
jgi:integrase/recombinase XerD